MRRRHLAAILSATTGLALAGGPATAPAQAASSTHSRKATSSSAAHRSGHAQRPGEHGRARRDRTVGHGGTISAVDAVAGTVTVSHPGENGGAATITVGNDATITLDGAASTLADLPVGARVRITGTETDDVRTVTAVDAVTSWPLRLEGTVGAVGDGTLTLTAAAGRHVTVTVGADATVTLDGTATALAGLTTGARVHVAGTGSISGQTATAVTARSVKTPAAAVRVSVPARKR